MRFIVMTLVMVTRIPKPYRVCESLDEALAWAEEQLHKQRPRSAG
ncbi:MAG: hypothetical protein ACT4TC_11285 [Myxococcaceae bacterium]